MAEYPHGVWIWNLPALSGNYLNRLIECKVKRVYLKVFDGKSRVMFWAKKNAYWNLKGSIVPQRGDIAVFDWQRNNSQLDHIGIVRGYTLGSSTIQTSEDNRVNRSGNFTREIVDVAGFIRIV
ncbi:CHAP domain-containing protein [Nostoc sp. PA-18-2419]|uniref:CHAP domain-containing protein n=1 Tax=Nostoc sp. PA-18-2419 TaxID=2575443 RepID=UPI001109B0B3|nr:CHAP domain-containing protein [Nostoc sp. PA-18-2419]